jgi:hypothetical protein
MDFFQNQKTDPHLWSVGTPARRANELAYAVAQKKHEYRVDLAKKVGLSILAITLAIASCYEPTLTPSTRPVGESVHSTQHEQYQQNKVTK